MRAGVAHWRGEIGVGLALIAIAVAFAALASGMPVGSFASPGPGLFPILLAALLVLGGLGIVTRAWIGRSLQDERVGLFPRAVVVALAALAIVAALFEPLGFLVAFAAFLIVLFRVLAKVSWMRAVVAGLAVAGGAHLLFERLLGVQLPGGVIGGF